MVKNPLDITNFIELSNEIIEIITDSNQDNDQIASKLLGDRENEQVNRIQEIICC